MEFAQFAYEAQLLAFLRWRSAALTASTLRNQVEARDWAPRKNLAPAPITKLLWRVMGNS